MDDCTAKANLLGSWSAGGARPRGESVPKPLERGAFWRHLWRICMLRLGWAKSECHALAAHHRTRAHRLRMHLPEATWTPGSPPPFRLRGYLETGRLLYLCRVTIDSMGSDAIWPARHGRPGQVCSGRVCPLTEIGCTGPPTCRSLERGAFHVRNQSGCFLRGPIEWRKPALAPERGLGRV
jgi:hypothetical protein